MAPAELRSSLDKFAAFARSLHGDEKSEAQSFLERFFRALGHEGAGLHLEKHALGPEQVGELLPALRTGTLALDEFELRRAGLFRDTELECRAGLVDRVFLRELADRASAFNVLLPHA